MNCKKVFNKIVDDLCKYFDENKKLESMILGISGGIDSTLCAAICMEVQKRTGKKLIGRSLPILNKVDEEDLSDEVGKTIIGENFKKVNLYKNYKSFSDFIKEEEGDMSTPISEGNIQARLRMNYLFNLASLYHGIVIGTDNRTEWNLGFWTLHGDVGDIYPIMDLWKTEVYKLSKWVVSDIENSINLLGDDVEEVQRLRAMSDAINKSIAITPTDGLGISNSDLDQIGATSYDQVDYILKHILNGTESTIINLNYTSVIKKIKTRHENSEFKRFAKPIKINITQEDKK